MSGHTHPLPASTTPSHWRSKAERTWSDALRQKRITLDGDDYYLDLLFFHRRMQRLVAIELELGDFKPADSGQIELYLRWLDRHERQPSEQAPLGIILCAGKKRETVEYLDLARDPRSPST